MSSVFLFQITPPTPERLDKILQSLMPQFSRRYLRSLIVQGSVYVNNKRIRRQSFLLPPHQPTSIVVYCYQGEQIEKIAQKIDWGSRVLHKDEQLIAIDKPPGIPTAPTRESYIHNCYFYLQKSRILLSKFFPFHRLDKDTSGVLIIPLKRATIRYLQNCQQENRIQKTYLALVHGIPVEKRWSVEGYLSSARGRKNPVIFSSTPQPGYRYSRTDFHLLGFDARKNIALLRAVPATGRTHQIRVHLQVCNHPILGVSQYGPPSPFSRFLLHCHNISFPYPDHPLSLLSISAQIPQDFLLIIESFTFLDSTFIFYK